MEWIVSSKDSGVKLLSFLVQHLESNYSAKSLKRIIEQNGCRINGRTERFASTLLGEGDRVAIDFEEKTLSIPTVEPSRIIYEDESLFVYDKPAGVTCDEKGILKRLDPSLILVHRLDRETTGILLLAKSSQVFENLVSQFKQLQVDKQYLAIVDGVIKERRGLIENYLGKKRAYAGQTIWGAVKPTDGLTAITEWHCLKTGDRASLVACHPKTGRTHQIRVHLSEMGHPILGDYQYGKNFQCRYRPGRILLHADEIRFRHPLSGEIVFYKAPLPNDFEIAQKELFKEGVAKLEHE